MLVGGGGFDTMGRRRSSRLQRGDSKIEAFGGGGGYDHGLANFGGRHSYREHSGAFGGAA